MYPYNGHFGIPNQANSFDFCFNLSKCSEFCLVTGGLGSAAGLFTAPLGMVSLLGLLQGKGSDIMASTLLVLSHLALDLSTWLGFLTLTICFWSTVLPG